MHEKQRSLPDHRDTVNARSHRIPASHYWENDRRLQLFPLIHSCRGWERRSKLSTPFPVFKPTWCSIFSAGVFRALEKINLIVLKAQQIHCYSAVFLFIQIHLLEEKRKDSSKWPLFFLRKKKRSVSTPIFAGIYIVVLFAGNIKSQTHTFIKFTCALLMTLLGSFST